MRNDQQERLNELAREYLRTCDMEVWSRYVALCEAIATNSE